MSDENISVELSGVQLNAELGFLSAQTVITRIENSKLIPLAKKAIIFNVLAKLTIDNSIKVTELVSEIKKLFSDDPETIGVVINIILSVSK